MMLARRTFLDFRNLGFWAFLSLYPTVPELLRDVFECAVDDFLRHTKYEDFGEALLKEGECNAAGNNGNFHPLSRYSGLFFASIAGPLVGELCLGNFSSFSITKITPRSGNSTKSRAMWFAPALIAYPPAFEAIYSFNRSLEKGNFYDFSRDARTRIYNVFGIRTNEAHRKHRRKVVGLALSPGKVDMYDFVISKNVSCLCRLSEAQASSVNGEVVNIAPYVRRYTFGAMVKVIFDEPICSQPSTSLIHLHQHLDYN
jgi:hypothetical protein